MLEILDRYQYNSNHPERPLVVAYFTANTPYEKEAKKLRVSLERCQYSYHVCRIRNLGSWQKNSQIKAVFIRKMLDEYSQNRLLYLDVDSIMIKPPVLLDKMDADIGAAHFGTRRELLSGTLYLSNSFQCNRIIQKWVHINSRYPETLPNGRKAWDQRTLAMVLGRMKSVKFAELPQEYVYITGLTQRYSPDLDPVILHTRGSHRFRRRIDSA